jgi:hypothetical protein
MFVEPKCGSPVPVSKLDILEPPERFELNPESSDDFQPKISI